MNKDGFYPLRIAIIYPFTCEVYKGGWGYR